VQVGEIVDERRVQARCCVAEVALKAESQPFAERALLLDVLALRAAISTSTERSPFCRPGARPMSTVALAFVGYATSDDLRAK